MSHDPLFSPRAGAAVPDAAGLAFDLYGLPAAAAVRLPGEYDANFRLTGAEGAGHVLKVMRPGCPRALLELQQEALEHLAVAAPDLALPRVVRSRDGAAIRTVAAPDGSPRLVWMLTWVPGRVLAESRPRSPELLQSLGTFLGRLDAALAGFAPPTAHRDLKWDLARAGWIREHLGRIAEPARRALVETVLDRFEAGVAPGLPALRKSTIHNDANDWNVIVRSPRAAAAAVHSLIDFGDMVHTCTVFEVAVAAAYALLGEREPLAAAARVVAGYHAAFPLTETEISLLFLLITTRLAVSVTNSACNRVLAPDDPYLVVSEAPAWEALERLAPVHPRFAHAVFREACGLAPVADAAVVADWLRRLDPEAIGPVLDADLRSTPCTVLDLSVGSLMLGADPASLERETLDGLIARELRAAGTAIGIGRYDEARLVYTEPAFGAGPRPTDERRTIHLGIDLFVPAGTPVYAPLDGTVEAFADHAARQDYGPVIVLRHAAGDGPAFFTLWGHLSRASLDGLAVGRPVPRGARVGWVGPPPENGDWPPHLHLQVVTDLFDRGTDVPGVARASERAVWRALAPDPNLLLGIPAERFPPREPAREETLARRRAATGGNVRLSYRRPLQMVRGWMQHLYDDTGRAYLDVFNNVPLVGHSHPRVVRAVQAQMALLNTNTRYLHPNLVRYAERLTRRMPAPLRVCYMLSSASEANELALRLARTHTGRRGVIVLEHAYHGNTGGLIDISPYKLNGPGGGPPPPWVHVAPIPDDYRGPYKRNDPDAGAHYARHVADGIPGEGLAAFIAETLPSVGGQIVLPPGYLKAVYAHVRAAGGLCIADEVQVGFGRLGIDFWGFGTQGVVPDIVVLGKPIGNGFPLAAVVTTPAVAASFDNGMEFFSTFGGNPVACAAGLAVLDVVEEEGLQEHARRLGDRLLAGLRDLQSRHALVGDVRGLGLFLGAELVRDRETLEPAGEEAGHVADRLRERGILAGTDGPHHNVLKIRPPLILQENDADFFLEVLDEVLGEDAVRVG
ncbi:MAG TPA: hypothetical protein DD490_04690 [Acidobacteria bacterium]|nr:hypothetical protein [Acidobacteriota bacterium]